MPSSSSTTSTVADGAEDERGGCDLASIWSAPVDAVGRVNVTRKGPENITLHKRRRLVSPCSSEGLWNTRWRERRIDARLVWERGPALCQVNAGVDDVQVARRGDGQPLGLAGTDTPGYHLPRPARSVPSASLELTCFGRAPIRLG